MSSIPTWGIYQFFRTNVFIYFFIYLFIYLFISYYWTTNINNTIIKLSQNTAKRSIVPERVQRGGSSSVEILKKQLGARQGNKKKRMPLNIKHYKKKDCSTIKRRPRSDPLCCWYWISTYVQNRPQQRKLRNPRNLQTPPQKPRKLRNLQNFKIIIYLTIII